ncbi:hybrid sensor histidine kinase/response regulator [Andreprevotia chitinilytica]|uniref:hybrid sensor histidine kinase/response regulator n=1 Tax=Andreprevotia chitinilytica TaxID=396808 RepID=UPI000689F6FD|nr:hybrid sensor histidine kinase/response regulator [Andreprevotia chitinilytica]
MAVGLGLCASIAVYCYLSAQNEISAFRKVFNNGYTNGRDYFERNEAYIQGLIKTVDVIPTDYQFSSEWGRESFYFHATDASPTTKAAISLSPADKLDLQLLGANLIYLDSKSGTANYLYRPVPSNPVSLQILPPKLAARQEISPTILRGIQWLKVDGGAETHFYVFAPIDIRSMPNAWLGLELSDKQIQDVFRQATDTNEICCIDYLMLSTRGDVLDRSSPQQVDPRFLHSLMISSEGFEVRSYPVFTLSLRKALGSSQWSLVYYASYTDVLYRIRYKIMLGLMSGMLSCLLLWLAVRLIGRHVLTPAQLQADQILESEAFNRTMLELAPVGLCVVRRGDHSIVLQNEQARQLLQLQAEPDGRHQSLAELLAAYPLGNQYTSGSTLIPLFDLTTNAVRHVQVAMAQTRYQGESVLLCGLNDVSVHKQAEAALEAARQAADHANESKSAFLAMMSHEIRTPLYGALGTLELLSLTDLAPQQRAHLQTIQSSSGALLQIINDILDFSKIEAGQLDIERTPLNPIELVEGLIRSFVPLARKKGVDLYCCLQPDLPLLLGDSIRLQQVLSNLLSNAVKFTDSGKIVVRLDAIETKESSVTLALQVADSGIGISRAEQQLLFEPFSQADGSTARRFGGTGLGLSICRRLVTLMGGKIAVVSESGLGTSVTVTLALSRSSLTSTAGGDNEINTLPTIHVLAGASDLRDNLLALIQHAGGVAYAFSGLGHSRIGATDLLLVVWPHQPAPEVLDAFAGAVWLDPDGPLQAERVVCGWRINCYSQHGIVHALQLAHGRLAATSPETVGALPRQCLGLRVLAVDDHPINRLLLKGQLIQLGCVVSLAKDGYEALRYWESGEKYDVMLTDVNMPGLDGYQLTRTLRRQGIKVPIIGVTANALAGELERCRTAGMNDYLPKPVSLAALQRTLLDVVGAPPEASPNRPGDVTACTEPEASQLLNIKKLPQAMQALFFRTAAEDWDGLQRGLAKQNTQTVRYHAHRLKGACAVIGATYGETLCGEIEVCSEKGSFEDIDKYIAPLRRFLKSGWPTSPLGPDG